MTDINKTIQFEYYREQSRKMASEIVELQSERRGLIAECQSLSIELENVKTECDKKIIELESTLNKSTNDVVRLTAWLDEVLKALNVHPFASINHVVDRVHATVNRVNELETQQTYSEIKLNEQLDLLRKTIDTEQMTHDCLTAALEKRIAELEARPVLTEDLLSATIMRVSGLQSDRLVHAVVAALGPVTLPPAQDRAEELAAARWAAWRDEAGDTPTTPWDDLRDHRRASEVRIMKRALRVVGAPPTSLLSARPNVNGAITFDGGICTAESARRIAAEFNAAADAAEES